MGTSVTACEVNGDGLTGYVAIRIRNTGDVNLNAQYTHRV